MPKFRKKPVIIEAVQFLDNPHSIRNLDKFIPKDIGIELDNMQVVIPTLEGVMRANVGDYIIKGVRGEFYPCNPDIFEATYEPVD